MITHISIDEYYAYLKAEHAAELRRGKWLNEYFGTWNEDAMSNRKKVKEGHRATYNAIDEIARIRNTFAGRYNAYGCQKCGKAYLTLDVDHGTTPMFGPCFATQGCDGRAVSMGYPEGDPPAEFGEPIIHWVKPTEAQLWNFSPELRDHVNRGGLIRQATEATPTWVRELL
jgi:hypothetical protein